jgi:hypothetical protein
MSIALDTRHITEIYALGQWFKVKKGTLCVDAYELRDYVGCIGNPEELKASFTDYLMGSVYNKNNQEQSCKSYGPNSAGVCSTVSTFDGVVFIEEDTEKRVAFSLLEVKAFKE